MASLMPRASGFWTDTTMSNSHYFGEDNEDLEHHALVDEEDIDDGRTPLDKTIDRIGMGSYQWTLLSLCGFGWMADNMWIQAVAIILPRVQQHYAVPDSYIGTLSSSMFAGMMLGAIGWGTCSDLMGRSTAFNATLFFTALFGLTASFANSFRALCVALFFLGSSVGGSMPTDGTLLLEHMPKEKQYLVTALSVFFSFGAVLSAVVALLVLPQHSCMSSMPDSCDMSTQNQGWKYLLITLGLITLSMFLARMVFFRLHESPRYLVHAGRPHDALKSLQMISRFNGSDLSIELEDVRDHPVPKTVDAGNAQSSPPKSDTDGRQRATSITVFDASVIEDRPAGRGSRPSSSEISRPVRSALVTAYDSTGETPILDAHSLVTPVGAYPPGIAPARDIQAGEDVAGVEKEHPESPNAELLLSASTSIDPIPITHYGHLRNHSSSSSARIPVNRRMSTSSRMSSVYERRVCRMLPRWLRRPLWAWWDRVMMVLEPDWVRTTVLVWLVWCTMSLAYTMFNVFLPKLLETGSTQQGRLVPKTLEQSLWDVVIFTIGGCPGALLGAWLIESPIGRRWSLAGSTFVTAFFCVVFVMVESSWAVRASTVGISLSATAMWAVLYGWTPEIFGTKVRGTACGIASALSRIGGMIAPILGGVLLMIDRSIPVYTSVVIFAIAGCAVLLLKEEERDTSQTKGERLAIH